MSVTFFANCFGTMALCIDSMTDLRQNSSESSMSHFRLNLNVCKVGNWHFMWHSNEDEGKKKN